jgi:hypothetical protein
MSISWTIFLSLEPLALAAVLFLSSHQNESRQILSEWRPDANALYRGLLNASNKWDRCSKLETAVTKRLGVSHCSA